MNEKIYLNVPYSQKDTVKSLGAKWNPQIKKWYYEGSVNKFPLFGKWIPETEIIAYEKLYIIEGIRTCHSCKRKTTIIGIGISKHSTMWKEDDGYCIDTDENDTEIHLSWFISETDIPPFLLKYLKEHYNVKTTYSKTLGEYCFANCCEHCGKLQGNYYLFNESSPLSTDAFDEELISRMKALNIKTIYIDEALPLNLETEYCSNDWAYRKYANFKNLESSEN